MVKKRGLGKSLDALLSYTNTDSSSTGSIEDLRQENITHLNVEQIQRGRYQPRREIDTAALEELAHSIRAQGILQPLIVREVEKQVFEIIAGERRWRAAQLAGLSTVPVIIRTIPDEAAMAIALIENIQRENLNAIEEAYALQRLSEEFAMTHQQVAEAVGKSRTSVTNLLRLLSLPDEVKSMLDRKLIEMGHARTLLSLPAASQVEVAELIILRGLSVRETEQLVKQLQSPATAKQNAQSVELDPDIQRLQDNLSRQLKLRVAIQCNAKGKGKVVIHYRSLAELNSVLSQFQESLV